MALLAGCSQHGEDLLSLREKRDGIIVKSSESSMRQIETAYGTEAEVIDADMGLYLIKGVSQDEVKDLGISVKTFSNTFVDVPRTLPYPKVIANTIKELLPMTEDEEETPTTEPAVFCNKMPGKSPLPIVTINQSLQKAIDINTDIEIQSNKSISNLAYKFLKQTDETLKATEAKLNEVMDTLVCDPAAPKQGCIPKENRETVKEAAMADIVRDGVRSGNIQLRSENLEVMWFLEDSVGKVQRFNTQSVTFRPTRVGQYTAHLLIVDPISKGCGFQSQPIYITANTKLSARALNVRKLKKGAESGFVQLSKTGNVEARKASTGKDVLVAVIDSGVNYNHPSLRPNIAVNQNEIPDNGIDDDKNGLIDDVYGYDFANNDAYPFDDNKHGTHVAGIIAATDIGLAPDAKILPIKVLPGPMASILKGMAYAVKMKASVANMSLRGYARTPLDTMMMEVNNPFEEVIKSGIATHTLFALAAGNETINNDYVSIWPAKSQQSNALTIAAITEAGELTPYSNYGKVEVDIAAYGGTEFSPIFSTNLHADVANYIGLSGTSMATPVVSGIAVQIKQILPDATAEEVIEILRRSSIANDNLKEKIRFASQVSSVNAVKLALTIKDSGRILP